MKKKATLMVLLLLAVCQVALASDAAKLTLPRGMNNPMTLRYPELANAPAPAFIKEGLRATYEALSLSPGLVDSDPDTGMKVSVIQSGPDGVIMEKTNDVNYKLLALYDASGKLVQTSLETYSGTATAQQDDLQLTG